MKNRDKKKWQIAESDYEMFKIDLSMPFFGRPEPETQIEHLNDILSGCPDFFPAIIDLGLQQIKLDLIEEGITTIVSGVELLFKLGSEEEKDHYFESLTTILMNLCFFDAHIKVLKIALATDPKNADWRDQLAFISIRNGDFKLFKENIEEALKLKPGNPIYANTYGLGLLMNGNLDEAEDYLETALCSSESREAAQTNMETLKWLRNNKDKKYNDFFAQSISDEARKEAEEIGSEKLFHEESNNAMMCVIQDLGRENKYRELRIIRESMDAFFGFCSQISSESFCLKNFYFFEDNIKAIMHKFIFKHGDVDEKMIRELFTGLTAFYTSYAKYDTSIQKDVKKFNKRCESLLEEMLVKVEKYNAVRHDYSMDQGKLEDIREELFEGDHDWMFL